MASAKISDLAALTSPATGDLAVVVDVSDTSMAASGTDKKITLASLLSGAPGGMPTLSKSANYTPVAGDKGKVIKCSATLTLSLTAAATLGNGWWCYVENTGNQLAITTIDPDSTEQVDGATTAAVYSGEMRLLWCDGSAFYSFLMHGQRLIVPPSQPTNSGKYLTGSPWLVGYVGSNSNTLTQLKPIAIPFSLSVPIAFDRIAVYTANATSANLGMWMYDVGSDGRPNNLLLDAGTIATSSSASKEITISQTLPPGNYFLVVCSDAVGVALYGDLNARPSGFGSGTSFTTSFFQRTSALASLTAPSTFGAGSWQDGVQPNVYLRQT